MMVDAMAISHRTLAIPFIVTLLGVALLLSLGKWQLDRREWKLGITQRIETRVQGEPISLKTAEDHWRKSQDVDYYRVLLVGRFLHGYERHLYTIVDGQAGWRVITPLETAKAQIVLVDRGFVPEQLKDAKERRRGQVEDTVELIGLARGSETKNWFTPDHEPAANRWFWRDVPGLIASLPAKLSAGAVPFIVQAEAAPVPGNWPRGGVTRLAISNRHLGYALTWFSLAAALLTVFAVYARNQLRRPSSGGHARIADEDSSV